MNYVIGALLVDVRYKINDRMYIVLTVNSKYIKLYLDNLGELKL